MKKFIKKIFRSDFNRNVLILSGGTAISQLLLIFISPVLTRLYTPEAFGIYAIFLSITAIVGGNINLKYEQAILLPKDNNDAYKLSYLASYLNIFLSLVLFFIIVLFYQPIAVLLKIEKQSAYWLYLIPVATYFIGFSTVLINLNNRAKNYKSMSGSVIAKNTSMTVVQLIFGFLKILLNSGLIIGQLVAYLFGNRILRIKVKFSYREMFQYKYNDLKGVMKRYRDFPRFAFPAGIANAATLNISNLLISSVYSVSVVGFFSFANRILGAPSVLLSQSIGQVFYQKACEEIHLNGNCYKIFKSTLKKLLIMVLPIYLPIAFISSWIFPIVFGQEWALSGTFASILSGLFAFRFVSSSLSVILDATEHQKYSLIINLVLLIINVLVIAVSFFLNLEVIVFVYIYSISMSMAYLSFIMVYYKLSKKKSKLYSI